MQNSRSLVSARSEGRLAGLGNAISDGALVVCHPHLLVLPEFRGQGAGSEILRRLKARYEGFHQHTLVADAEAAGFYEKCGFALAGSPQSMWICGGGEH